jgi:hypothetical protein
MICDFVMPIPRVSFCSAAHPPIAIQLKFNINSSTDTHTNTESGDLVLQEPKYFGRNNLEKFASRGLLARKKCWWAEILFSMAK